MNNILTVNTVWLTIYTKVTM